MDELLPWLKIQRGWWVHQVAPRPAIGVTPHVVVYTHDKLCVRHYPPAHGMPASAPVVIVPSMINRAAICDLEPERSLVAGLAALGHDVYLVDWGTPGEEDADEDVGYALLTLLDAVVRRVARRTRARGVHLFGWCMGGTLCAMYTALRPARVLSLSTLGAPAAFAAAGRFRDLVAGLDVDRAFPAGTLVPVEVMRPAFQLLDPVGAVTKYGAIDDASRDAATLRRTLARERWLEENVPLPSAFAREFVRCGYQQDRLLAGAWEIRGERVDLGSIHVPTLVVACDRDFVSPLASVTPLADAIDGARLEVVPSGHIGVVVGGYGPSQFYPTLNQFFREVSP
ncbi:MAG: alpha/beta fold hydrolase [Myxococcota bacterium]